MSRRKQSRGKCAFCGKEMAKGGLSKHLSSCSKRREAINTANQKSGKTQRLYHLLVQDAWQRDFWLHLEMNGTATLGDLDHYLRAIWLECCGHLSQFSVGGWSGDEIPMRTRAAQIFDKGVELTHIYDFGTSSETLIKVVGINEGKPQTKHPIFLMGRNELPQAKCMECGQLASWICIECLYETEDQGLLCDEHVEEHPHDNYGPPMPLLNSPRVGMCGYDGPAEPPY